MGGGGQVFGDGSVAEHQRVVAEGVVETAGGEGGCGPFAVHFTVAVCI